MIYKILADFVVLIHFLWIVFLMIGSLVGVHYRLVKWIHGLGLLFSVFLQIFQWYCPLTYLEIWLRAKHDPALTYTGSYIIHYLEELVYLEVSRTVIFVATVVIIVLNGWYYYHRRHLVSQKKRSSS
ncbi:MAG: DUF2784 domain-containing protein [bacterium]|nr:DUF2784 domain-containing protein [bacterium]